MIQSFWYASWRLSFRVSRQWMGLSLFNATFYLPEATEIILKFVSILVTKLTFQIPGLFQHKVENRFLLNPAPQQRSLPCSRAPGAKEPFKE